MGKRIKALLISMAVLLVAMVSLASCGKRTYSVMFKSGTETVAVAETDKEGRVYPAYAECAEGVRFVGWYESEESTTPFDFEKEITSDKTLYARFASLTYEVKYDAGCEGLKAPVQESVNHDGTFTVKAAPDRVGYEFKGWTDGSGLYFDGDVYVADGGTITLVATWEYRVLTVEFLDDKGEAFETKEVPYLGDSIPPSNAPHTYFAYEFVGWDLPTSALERVTEDLTVRAEYVYAPADESNFVFEETEDGEAYAVSAKEPYSLSGELALPKTYKGKPVREVARNGFNHTSMEKLFIPSSYRTVKAEGFYGNSSLKAVYIEEGLETIEAYAFQSIGLVTCFELPASLKNIKWHAFADLFNDMNGYLWLEDEQKQIMDEFAFTVAEGGNFVWDEELKCLYDKDYTKLIFVSPSLETLDVPVGVEEIYPSVCSDYLNLKTLNIAAHLKEIGPAAFSGAWGLTNLNIKGSVEKLWGTSYVSPDGVDVLNNGVFFDTDLRSVVFPDGLKFIDGGTFFWNQNLEEITLPATVEYISEQAFDNNYSSIPGGTSEHIFKTYLANGGLKTIKLSNGATQTANGKYVFDGKSVIEKGAGANGGDFFIFYCMGAEGATYSIPEGVTKLNLFAFSENLYVETLIIPEGAEEIPCGFAMNAQKLKRVEIPASVKLINNEIPDGLWGNIMMWGSYGAFVSCANLTEIVFAENSRLEVIKQNSFLGIGAEKLELPASLTELESFSIYGENMTEVVVGEGNTYFKTVDGVLYSADGKKLILYPGGKQGETFTSPAGTETIGAGSFNNNYFLRKVIFSEGVVLLEPNAFNRCYNADYDEETWEILRKYGLKEVVLPSTLEYIGDLAFSSCNMLEKIVFNGAVPELGKEYGANALGTEDWETGEVVLFDNLKFEVPDQYIKDYYLAFYTYRPNYAKGFDEAKLPKVSYVFDSKGGSAIDGVSAIMVEKMPVPEKEGAYFHGWYSVDGTASGEWGDMVAFPYLYDGGESVTLYARWENTRKQDGTMDIWGFELVEGQTVSVTMGASVSVVWFTFTPEEDCVMKLGGLDEIDYWTYVLFDRTGMDMTQPDWWIAVPDMERNGYKLKGGVTYYIYVECICEDTEINFFPDIFRGE